MENPWKEFKLMENCPDPGGGILYALRYDPESLDGHQEAVIAELQDMGVQMVEGPDNGLLVGATRQLDDAELDRFSLLIQELSVVNEAIEYRGVGLADLSSTEELAEELRKRFFMASIGEDKTLAAGILQQFLPQVLGDVMYAQKENAPLDEADYEHVEELARWVTEKITGFRSEGLQIISFDTDGPNVDFDGDDLIY